MPVAYSYLRFSTAEQAKGDSQRRQHARYDEICRKHKLIPATRYFHDLGKSAWKGGKQRDLQQFLHLVKSGEIPGGSWLVVESLDRLSRQGFRKTQKLLEEIIENKIVVATCNP